MGSEFFKIRIYRSAVDRSAEEFVRRFNRGEGGNSRCYLQGNSLIIPLSVTNPPSNAMAEATTLAQQILSEAHEGILVVDRDFRYHFWNPEMERLTGVSAKEVLGQTPWKIFPFLREIGLIALLERALAGETLISPDFQFSVPSTGREGWNYQKMGPIRDSTGRITGAIVFVHDITERKRAEDESHRLASLVRHSTDFTGLATPDARYAFLNEAGRRMVGLDKEADVHKTTIYDYFAESEQERIRNTVIPALFSSGLWTGEINFRHFKTGSLIPTEATAFAICGFGSAEVAYLACVARDITERKQAEAAVRASEERLRLALAAGRMGTFDWNMDTNRIVWSHWQHGLWGLRDREFNGIYTSLARRIHPEDLPAIEAEVRRCMRKGEPFRREFRIVIADRRVRWMMGRGEFIFDATGRALRMRGVVSEITDRKEAEQSLLQSRQELQALAARVRSAREEEAGRIARELHDELGANLTGLKIDIAWLERQLGQWRSRKMVKPLLQRINRTQQVINSTMRTVRKICLELRPDVLDQLGLAPAIEWQAAEFQSRYGISCDLARVDMVELSGEAATAVFRIFQEILTNIARHAQATKVRLTLRNRANQVVLQVSDNGIGISSARTGSTRGLGLVGMRERALAAGGEFKIESRRGRGTVVTVRIPVDRHPIANDRRDASKS